MPSGEIQTWNIAPGWKREKGGKGEKETKKQEAHKRYVAILCASDIARKG